MRRKCMLVIQRIFSVVDGITPLSGGKRMYPRMAFMRLAVNPPKNVD